MVRVALLLLVALTAPVQAGPGEATFAKAFGVSPAQVHDVAEFPLPAGGDMTHVVIGRYELGSYVMAGALLMTCAAAECEWRRIEFGAAEAVEVNGVVDLHGAPGPLPSRAVPRGSRITGPRAMKFPAAVFRTRESKRTTGETRARRKVEGTETRTKLYLVSLVEADRGSVVLMDTAEQRSATGRGFVRSYRLDKPEAKGVALDLVASERTTLDRDSRCRAPEPAETIHALDERHFRTKKVTPSKGC